MKTSNLLLTLSLTLATATAAAQPAQTEPAPTPPPPAPALPTPQPAVTPAVTPALAVTPAPAPLAGGVTETGWNRPPGTRLLHGIRIGYNYIYNYEKATRENGMSLKDEFGLKTPHTMILGYEAMYRIVGHSWLNVVMVGNVSIAGFEQSKFIPTASGLIGAELNESFQIGVGVNMTPDAQAPTHMIAAVGWTPKVGSIFTPVHFFFVPDAEGNHRTGATVGVTW